MSVLDELHGLEQHVAKRLAELEPLAKEYEELKRVAARLGIAPDSRVTKATGPGRRASRSRSEPGRKADTGRGSRRREAVVAAVVERPGITVAEVGDGLGVDPTSLYRVIRRLEADGRLRKVGRTLHPA